MFERSPIQECNIRSIYSVRRNPVIANLFHRMKYMDHRGSGLKKIISKTEKLPGYIEQLKPEVFSTATDFLVILKNVNYDSKQNILVTNQVNDLVSDQVKLLIIKQQILDFCKAKKQAGEFRMTISDKPNRQNQNMSHPQFNKSKRLRSKILFRSLLHSKYTQS